MADVTLATQHLLRYLKHRQDEGVKRAFLTDEAKTGLRAVYFHARQPRETVVPAPAPQHQQPVQEVHLAAVVDQMLASRVRRPWFLALKQIRVVTCLSELHND